MRDYERREPVAIAEGDGIDGGRRNLVGFPTANDHLLRLGGGESIGFSYESEHDLAAMVSDFLENGSGGAESWCSSDSDSGSDLSHLADLISVHRRASDQYERDLLSVVQSLILSIDESNHHFDKAGPCNGSCIRFSLVKLLKVSGYDAAVCTNKWQGLGKVPGGDHEYIDVISHHDHENPQSYIIDMDFRSHFEIARAVQPYNKVLDSLPPVYVGSHSKLNHFLQIMVDAAKISLHQNSMPLPPWRSLAYLQAKWDPSCHRATTPDNQIANYTKGHSDHIQCIELLRRLKSCIQSEIRSKGLMIKPPKNRNKNRMKEQIWRLSSFGLA